MSHIVVRFALCAKARNVEWVAFLDATSHGLSVVRSGMNRTDCCATSALKNKLDGLAYQRTVVQLPPSRISWMDWQIKNKLNGYGLACPFSFLLKNKLDG